jgi:ankyrin repeat protein
MIPATSVFKNIRETMNASIVALPSIEESVVRAAEAGLAETVKKLTILGATLPSLEESLFHAASHGHTDLVKLLLGSGAREYITDSEGNSALALACLHGHIETVQVLFKKWHKSDGRPLVAAAATGQDEMVQMFIDGGSPVFVDALTGACEGAHESTVRLLFDTWTRKYSSFPNKNPPGYTWRTAMSALLSNISKDSWKARAKIIEILGARPGQPVRFGLNEKSLGNVLARMMHIQVPDIDSDEFRLLIINLLTFGANPTLFGADHTTAIYEAFIHNRPIAELIMDTHQPHHWENSINWGQALIQGIELESEPFVEFILNRAVGINLKKPFTCHKIDGSGPLTTTALDVAIGRGNIPIVRMLLKRGAIAFGPVGEIDALMVDDINTGNLTDYRQFKEIRGSYAVSQLENSIDDHDDTTITIVQEETHTVAPETHKVIAETHTVAPETYTAVQKNNATMEVFQPLLREVGLLFTKTTGFGKTKRLQLVKSKRSWLVDSKGSSSRDNDMLD